MGLKPRRSTTAFGRIVPVVKVINHLKNLAVERRSAQQETIESMRFCCIVLASSWQQVKDSQEHWRSGFEAYLFQGKQDLQQCN
ncbi:hypothetical protein [Microcoleus sp. CAWBG58]|uniref:hypothetical protein n=1 Tax=Microcoleus sp. CAWBG58 TaxID=2841651 RepID=UPI0025DB0248|nr:hypothetical protein [Microcoleus sp. CAWBG58]